MSFRIWKSRPRSFVYFLAAGLAFGTIAVASKSYAQQTRYAQTDVSNAFDLGNIHVVPVQGSVYMLVGAGANIAVSVGQDGVLLVDSGTEPMADQVLAAIRQLAKPLTHNPIRYIINTNPDPDHVGGNIKIAKAGRTFTGGNVAGDLKDAGEGAAIIAHENVANRMSAPTGKVAPFPYEAVAGDTYVGAEFKISEFVNGDGIRLIHVPGAHTDGDSVVHFRKSDVIATGDIFNTTYYPAIDIEKGGGIQGFVDGLNMILNLAIPEFRMEGGTLIIPGHGRLCDAGDVSYYRDMVSIVRDRVDAAIKKGMTLEQVKAAGYTKDYDARYAAPSGPSTASNFIEAVYKSLSKKK
ncbi:MAG: MBL fold metallo-hydrolase [Bryobacteraceae bacterium]